MLMDQQIGVTPQRTGCPGIQFKPQPKMGKPYCVKLWKARCSVNAFLSRHPRGCKNATTPPKPDDDDDDDG